MTDGEAEDFLARFLSVADDRIELLVSRLVEIAGLDPTAMDYSVDSHRVFWAAAAPLLKEASDVHGLRADDPPIWWSETDPYQAGAPRHRMWLQDGYLHYLARCILRGSDGLWWDWERNRKMELAGQPCIVGFKNSNRLHPIYRGLGVLGRAQYEETNSSPRPGPFGRDGAAVLEAAHRRWLNLAPDPGTPPVEPVWVWSQDWDYELSHVNVSLPSFSETEHWLDEAGHDWDGSWLVDVPQGIIADVEPRADYARILEEALCRIDGVLRAEWVDKVVYLIDAPRMTEAELRTAVLGVLNRFRAECREREAKR
jgi:hypothetical protein